MKCEISADTAEFSSSEFVSVFSPKLQKYAGLDLRIIQIVKGIDPHRFARRYRAPGSTFSSTSRTVVPNQLTKFAKASVCTPAAAKDSDRRSRSSRLGITR